MRTVPVPPKANVTSNIADDWWEKWLGAILVLVFVAIISLIIHSGYRRSIDYQYKISVSDSVFRCNEYQFSSDTLTLNDCYQGQEIIIKYPQDAIIR